MKFESFLNNGEFFIPECKECKVVIWPPSDYCNRCFLKTKWRKANTIGKLLEFSKKDDKYFCLSQFENDVRIMGMLKTEPQKIPEIGHQVKLESCGIKNGAYYFVMKLGDCKYYAPNPNGDRIY